MSKRRTSPISAAKITATRRRRASLDTPAPPAPVTRSGRWRSTARPSASAAGRSCPRSYAGEWRPEHRLRVATNSSRRRPMPTIVHLAQAADREHAMPSDAGATLFAALELSLTSWVVVASAPGQDGASKHTVAACDGPGLLALLNRLRSRAEARCGHLVSVAVTGSGTRRILGTPLVGGARHCQPCRRPGFDRGKPAQPAGQLRAPSAASKTGGG